MRVRDARVEDLPEILRLTSAMRQQLAAWSPVYFRPREGADAAHGQFLEFVIGSPDQQASVFVVDDSVVGFFRQANLPHHAWVDDLCLREPGFWNDAARLLVDSLEPTSWVTCVSPHDADRIEALSSTGLAPISTYWSKSLPTARQSLRSRQHSPSPKNDRKDQPTRLEELHSIPQPLACW